MSRINNFFNMHVFMTNGAHKGQLRQYSDLLVDEAREILKEAFKRNSNDGTPNGLVGFIIGKLLIALSDPPSIQDALKIAKEDQGKYGKEETEVKRALKILSKIKQI